MRIFAVAVGLVALMLGLTALPLIPELIALRHGLLAALGLGGVALVLRNARQRWLALPDLRLRIGVWSGLSAVLCTLGMLVSLALSPIDAMQFLCDLRVMRIHQLPTGYPELDPGRATYRFHQSCIPDGEETWLQQSVLIFLVGPTVPYRG